MITMGREWCNCLTIFKFTDENAGEEDAVVYADGSVHHGDKSDWVSQPNLKESSLLSKVEPIGPQSQV